MARVAKEKKTENDEPLEKKLWKAADKLRKNMDAAEYKHIVLGLIFLKYISDAFEELYAKLKEGKGEYEGADPEDKNEYTAEKVFYVPPSARWNWLQGRAKLPTIGKDVDDAMDAIEKDNVSLKGVLPKVYAQDKLDKASIGGLIDLIGTAALGTKEARGKDLLGKVYEYFLGEFALAEGKKGGQFYTPGSVVRLLVEMLEPYEGRVFDPCCGSGGMFVQSEKFVEAHRDYYQKQDGKKLHIDPKDRISIYGQESNQTTWRLAKMNLAIRGIDASNVKWNNEGSFLNDMHKDLKADFIIANPPFNDSDWSGDLLRKDARWIYGNPPSSNANFAWIQHFIYHLSPTGTAGFVLANSALACESAIENGIRKGIIEDDLVDCIVTLPDKLFYSTPIPVSLWFLTRYKDNSKFRKRAKEILFIDASKLGRNLTRTAKTLDSEDINIIASTYHNWRNISGDYKDSPGFCKSVNLEEIKSSNYELFPAKYVGIDHKSVCYTKEAIYKDVKSEWLIYEEAVKVLNDKMRLVDELFNPNSNDVYLPKNIISKFLYEILEVSDERLGLNPEPEILTCTEKAGLIFQKDRFAKRIATDNTSKYKIVNKTDIVYNPYLLWAGAIDQCWIVDKGITSPAYEVLKIKEGYDATIIGNMLKSEKLIKMYSGISIGAIQRRRRAPVDKFLGLKVDIPSIEDQQKFIKLSNAIQSEVSQLTETRIQLHTMLKSLSKYWLQKY